jgi:hypothetical protein
VLGFWRSLAGFYAASVAVRIRSWKAREVRKNVNNSHKHERNIARCHFIWTFTEV